MTQLISVTRFLRYILLADALTCTVTGLLMTLGAEPGAELLGVPAGLSFYAGLGLFPFAGLLVYLAYRRAVSPVSIWVVVLLNCAWTMGSFALLVTDLVAPTTLGYAIVTAQACGVAMFAVLEYIGLRKALGQAPTNPHRGQTAAVQGR